MVVDVSKTRSTLSSADISFFTHATEDAVKVVKMVSNILGVAEDIFEQSSLEGHFGNPIRKFRARLLGREADRLAERVADLLDRPERESFIQDISKHIDEHGDLYLRLDKQSVFSGKVTRSQTDALRIRFKPRFIHSPSDAVKLYRRLFKAV